MTHVVVADGSSHTRRAVRLVLEQLDDTGSVDEAASTTDCLAVLAHTTVDLLLVDYHLPGRQVGVEWSRL